MTPKHRSAWIWLAVAALSIAVAARAQSGMQSARTYATPVIKFLAAHTADQPSAAIAVQRLLRRNSARADRRSAETNAWAAMLPVFFVGLVSPLNLVSLPLPDSTGHVPAAPALLSSFQRPPPQIL